MIAPETPRHALDWRAGPWVDRAWPTIDELQHVFFGAGKTSSSVEGSRR